MRKLFKWFQTAVDSNGKDFASAYVNWFVDTVDKLEYQGIERVLYCFLEYCDELGIQAKREYLESFLVTEGKYVIKYENVRLDELNIDYNEPGSLEEAYRTIAATTLVTYDEYAKDDLVARDFKVDTRAYFEEQRAESLRKAMADSFTQITGGNSSLECLEELQDKLDRIAYSYDRKKLEAIDFINATGKPRQEQKKMRCITKTGLPCVDEDTGGIYTKQVWNISGQPGAGKTRLAAIHTAYQAAVIGKVDVVFDELELSKAEVENILIAYHIVKLYGGRVKITDKSINRDELTDEQRRYVESARIDLFETSGKYGEIFIRDEGINVEDMKRKTLSFLRLHKGVKMWVIDYAGMADSAPKSKYDRKLDKADIITMVFDTAKRVAKMADIGFVILSQYTKEGNEAAYAGKKILPGMVQGGQAVQRYADFDMAMTMTEEQELAGVRCLSTVKKRSATGFWNVPYQTDLSVSVFRQQRVGALA